MNLLDTISGLASGTYSVTRYAAGSYDAHGRLVEGASATVQVVASVQPVGGRELMRLPEGLRTRELLSVWATSALFTASEANGTRADLLAVGADVYEVQLVEDWSAFGGGWKAIAAKVENIASGGVGPGAPGGGPGGGGAA